MFERLPDPSAGMVTVTGVDVTRDLRNAKVFVSVMGSDAERATTFEGLASVATHLRSRVGRALRLRLAPEITFRPDESIARASRIEVARPAFDDAHDGRVGLAPDEAPRLVAAHAAQRFDLLGDGGRQPRHGQVAPRAQPFGIEL